MFHPSGFRRISKAVGQSTTLSRMLKPAFFSCSLATTAVSWWFLYVESVRKTISSPL